MQIIPAYTCTGLIPRQNWIWLFGLFLKCLMFRYLDGFLQVELGHNFCFTGTIVRHYRWPSDEHIWQNLKIKIKKIVGRTRTWAVSSQSDGLTDPRASRTASTYNTNFGPGLSWSGISTIFSVLVRAGPRFRKFFRPWYGPVLGPGPTRLVRDHLVMVRESLIDPKTYIFLRINCWFGFPWTKTHFS